MLFMEGKSEGWAKGEMVMDREQGLALLILERLTSLVMGSSIVIRIGHGRIAGC